MPAGRWQDTHRRSPTTAGRSLDRGTLNLLLYRCHATFDAGVAPWCCDRWLSIATEGGGRRALYLTMGMQGIKGADLSPAPRKSYHLTRRLSFGFLPFARTKWPCRAVLEGRDSPSLSHELCLPSSPVRPRRLLSQTEKETQICQNISFSASLWLFHIKSKLLSQRNFHQTLKGSTTNFCIAETISW